MTRTATLADLRANPIAVTELAKQGRVSIVDEAGAHRFWLSIPSEPLTCCDASTQLATLRAALGEACEIGQRWLDVARADHAIASHYMPGSPMVSRDTPTVHDAADARLIELAALASPTPGDKGEG